MNICNCLQLFSKCKRVTWYLFIYVYTFRYTVILHMCIVLNILEGQRTFKPRY